MSVQRGVSIPTVVQAYRTLEVRRVIMARPQSGFYVRHPERLEVPERGRTGVQRPAGLVTGPVETVCNPTLTALDSELPVAGEIHTGELISRCVEMVCDPTLFPLGTALPDPSLLPSAALARLLGRAARQDARRSTSYLSASGLEDLRHAIARRAIDAGGTVAADDVIVTCGCTEALFLCLRALTRAGDTVAVESPTYFGTLQVLDSLGLKALEIPVDPDTGISLEVLTPALDRGGIAALIVTPNVHNPLGSVMPDDRKRALVELATAHEVPVIEDETYADLYFGAQRPKSLQAFDREGIVISCGSFSKTLAPGYRIGWAVAPRHRRTVLHHKMATTVATPVLTQRAVADYLSSGAYESHLRRLRRTFRSSVDRFAFEVERRLPAPTRLSRPAGGFLLWAQLPGGVDTVRMQKRALKRGLGIAPGPAFSASGEFKDYLRLNAGYRWSDRTGAALDLLAELVADAARA
jgi:DNA-binding transcriptional MocR family regulator